MRSFLTMRNIRFRPSGKPGVVAFEPVGGADIPSAREIGYRRGMLEAIALELAEKFGRRGTCLLPKLRRWPEIEALRKFACLLGTTDSLDDVRHYLKWQDFWRYDGPVPVRN